MKKRITFISQVYYLDAALEYIRELSKIYDVHVIIELTEDSKKSNVFNLNINLNKLDSIIDFYTVCDSWELNEFKDYFINCSSVSFLIFKSKKSISFQSIFTSYKLRKVLSKSQSDFYHFDDFSLRLFSLIPFLFFNKSKLILNIHDPYPHSGEYEFKKRILKYLLFKVFEKFVVFSYSSKELLNPQLKSYQKSYYVPLLPFSIYRKFINSEVKSDNSITFIGRISKYKGIDLFIDSFKKINSLFPNQNFKISGKPHPNFLIKEEYKNSKKLKFNFKHLSNNELVNLVLSSKVIVCPYLDATQSGVVMTSYALGKPVIVSNVGGLPEYVLENQTGYICNPELNSLTDNIIKMIKLNHDYDFDQNILHFTESLKLTLIQNLNNIYI
jgi:glycosyltransferase involved in cell wall biosynthesis